MNCPKCGHEIIKWRKRCEICGQDISVYERLQHISNSFYNKGLERAKVRDLSGAVEMLKRSLEINKENTEARNLLGLVFFEMGEAVAALSEWVISQNFQPQDNDAAYFLNKVQSDTVTFDGINQTIKKFNIALANAKRQDDDLAILQLKRVISQNPKFIRAMLLLALIYMKNCEYEKARRCLLRVQKIDVGNVTALRYLEEIHLCTQQGSQSLADNSKSMEETVSSKIVPLNTYREDKPNFMAFLTFFLGILIGVAVIYYMAVPNIRQSIKEEYNQKERNYSAALSEKDIEISSLESNTRILENRIDDLERMIRREEGYTLIDYEPFIKLLYEYQEYLKLESPSLEQTEALYQEVQALNMTDITEPEAVALFEDMLTELKTRTGAVYLEQGMELYAADSKTEALPLFEAAYTRLPDNPEVVYHLARCYHSNGDLEKAKTLYEILIDEHQESTRCQEAEKYLGYIKESQGTSAGRTE